MVGIGKLAVVGYFASWSIYLREFGIQDIDPSRYTHIIYCFFGISADTHQLISLDPHADFKRAADNAEITMDSRPGPELPGNMNDLFQFKHQNQSLKIGISVGGQTASSQFAAMTKTKDSRAVFIRSLLNLVINYGLDLVDFDWEFPQSTEEGENFVALLQEVYETMKTSNLSTEISVAIGCSENLLKFVSLPKMLPFVEFFNLMAYPFGTLGCPTVNPIAPLFQSNGECIANATDLILQMGVPAAKIMLGIPAFCYAYAGCSGFGMHHQGAALNAEGVLDVNELPRLSVSLDTLYDEGTASAISICKEQNFAVTHENAQTIQQKIEFALQKGLGGVMIWHIAADHQDENSFAKLAMDQANVEER